MRGTCHVVQFTESWSTEYGVLLVAQIFLPQLDTYISRETLFDRMIRQLGVA
jgi:putative copper export protein